MKEFRLRHKKVRPTIETMLDEASKVARDDGEYYNYSDVFGSDGED